MPSLTLNTSPSIRKASSDIDTHSTSPRRPPYSPITPTLDATDLASSVRPGHGQTYTFSQAPQLPIAPLPPQPMNFNENPDVLALKSTISILQLQKATAMADILTLQRIKERALKQPGEFARALTSGHIKSRSDPLFNPKNSNEDGNVGNNDESSASASARPRTMGQTDQSWETLPTPQNIVRTPPINFAQYAVIGESLDKLHADQKARPSDGVPERWELAGQYVAGGQGPQRQSDISIAAPYQPGKDKIEKMGTRKAGKR